MLRFVSIITFTCLFFDSDMVFPMKTTTPEEGGASQVYLLSGLGADERAFTRLVFDPRFTVHPIQWIPPQKHETLSHYAGRLVSQIDTTQPFQLVGLSFGGIMANILSEIIHPQQIIIISSMSSPIPVSRLYQNLLKVVLWHPLSGRFLKTSNRMTYRIFGAETQEEKDLLKQILKDSDSRFMKWALLQMSGWKRSEKLPNLYHIHGTEDRLIAPRLVHPDAWVEGGGHLMVYSHAKEVSRLLNQQLIKGNNPAVD